VPAISDGAWPTVIMRAAASELSISTMPSKKLRSHKKKVKKNNEGEPKKRGGERRNYQVAGTKKVAKREEVVKQCSGSNCTYRCCHETVLLHAVISIVALNLARRAA